MNKLTKVGLSALCGSLASIASASAGELNVKGSATATWSSNSGDVTGNPVGVSTGLTFTGTGELDNGSTFTMTLTHADQNAYSAGSISLATPSMGTLSVSSASGGQGIGGYDDKMPTAWEETWGTSLGTGIDLAKGVGSSMNVQWASPTFMGTTFKIAHAPANSGGAINDKSVGGDKSSYKQNGWDAVLDIKAGGQNVFLGVSNSERDDAGKSAGTNSDARDDHQEGVAGIILSIGPVQIGAQATAEYTGETQIDTAVHGYRNVAYGVAFNVSDNLSISYGELESKKGFVATEGGGTRVMEIDSIQAAYTMGGATIKIAETEVTKGKYVSTTANDKEATTIALSLAF